MGDERLELERFRRLVGEGGADSSHARTERSTERDRVKKQTQETVGTGREENISLA